MKKLNNVLEVNKTVKQTMICVLYSIFTLLYCIHLSSYPVLPRKMLLLFHTSSLYLQLHKNYLRLKIMFFRCKRHTMKLKKLKALMIPISLQRDNMHGRRCTQLVKAFMNLITNNRIMDIRALSKHYLQPEHAYHWVLSIILHP